MLIISCHRFSWSNSYFILFCCYTGNVLCLLFNQSCYKGLCKWPFTFLHRNWCGTTCSPIRKNSPSLCLCVFLLVWWSCQLPLAALQITKSSLTCWWRSQRRFTPCQTLQYQTATSRPWLRCVTWQTESWWWTLAGLNTSQVGKKRLLNPDFHAEP